MEINWPVFAFGNLIMDTSIAALAIISLKEAKTREHLSNFSGSIKEIKYPPIEEIRKIGYNSEQDFKAVVEPSIKNLKSRLESQVKIWDTTKYFKFLVAMFIIGILLQIIGIFYDFIVCIIDFYPL